MCQSDTITNWKAKGKPPTREDTKKLAKLLYLNEEEIDILLRSAGYASEYSPREIVEVSTYLRHLTQSDEKRWSREDIASSSDSVSSLPNPQSIIASQKISPHKTAIPFFMVEDLPIDFVQRPNEFEAIIDKLLNERKRSVAITAALRGAGGYGKTTIAKALCHDARIKETFHDGILWVTLGQEPSNLVGKIEDFIYILKRERPGFTSLDVATTYLAELLGDLHILLVIDDVWDASHLKPFRQGGNYCARLITILCDDRVLPPVLTDFKWMLCVKRRDSSYLKQVSQKPPT